MTMPTEFKGGYLSPPPEEFSRTAGKFFLWLADEHLEGEGQDTIERDFIKKKLQQLASSPHLLHAYYDHDDELGESITTPERSYWDNGTAFRIWRGKHSSVWSFRILFNDHHGESVRIVAVLAPQDSDMTTFLFPPSALSDKGYGHCQSTSNMLVIKQINEQYGSTETDFIPLREHGFEDDTNRLYTVWCAVDHGPMYSARVYEVNPNG